VPFSQRTPIDVAERAVAESPEMVLVAPSSSVQLARPIMSTSESKDNFVSNVFISSIEM
jgi:hypothetical protein